MAFSIIRIENLTVSSMQVVFNDDINTDVGISNISISSREDNIPSPDIISVSVENEIISIEYSPIFPNLQYKIEFTSTDDVAFSTVNGERITEDGNRNVKFITSPGENESDIRDAMLESLPPVYEVDEPTLVRKTTSAMAESFQTFLDSLETTKSGNYLSVLVEDESVTRDSGPIDRLENGGAFEIIRVGSTDASVATEMNFDAARKNDFVVRSTSIVNPILESLTDDPISLQSIDVVNEKVTDDTSLNNHFDGLIIKVSNSPIIQVIAVSLYRNGEWIEYDIVQFGYTLKSNRYDTALCGINVNLEDNEIELSSSSITGFDGGFVMPRPGDEIRVSYVYKRLGRDVDSDSIVVSTVKTVVRETTPAIINIFSLEHAPIVDSLGNVAATGGVEFLSTQSTDSLVAFTSTHPAFVKEIRYDVTRFPARAGEYTINYNTGEVVVYGVDSTNDGTGSEPPVANYSYKNIYTNSLDYTFNSDRDELSARSSRNITNIETKIEFNYEDTFAEGTDYLIRSHVESLNERVENRLVGSNKIKTNNFPITNVFRILNETTGEIYTLDRFNDTTITFNSRTAPKQYDMSRERVEFTRVPQEVLLIAEESTNINGLRIFKVNLENSSISDSKNRFVGSNFDTSVLFSNTNIFANEYFYDNILLDSVAANIGKLSSVGDYMIDYINGIVYVAVSSDQGTDIGDISYQYTDITTKKDHILSVYDIYRSYSAMQQNVKTYAAESITDITVSPVGIEQVGTRFINSNLNRRLVVGTHQSGEDGITTNNNNVFTSYTAIFTSSDIGKTLRVGHTDGTPIQDVTIMGVINDHEVVVNPNFTYTKRGRVWVVLDLSSGASKTINLDYDIVSVDNIYLADQLYSSAVSDLDGYFDIDIDSIDGNTITLGSTNSLEVGDEVVVNYNYGSLYIDYMYLHDEIVVSYEYGKNSLDWSISQTLNTEDEYFVTYKYGALRDSLLLNFGALTQIPQLTNFSPNLDRELYRSILGGTLQSFVEGPTIPSIERLVEAFTDVTPDITESAFGYWVLGRDYLHPRDLVYNDTLSYDLGKFKNGLVISGNQNIQVPAVSHIKLNEGTIETWIKPQWNGLSNDASLTFNLLIDGYADTSSVYIGFSGENPDTIPFTLQISDDSLTALSEPANIDTDTGYFIWYDDTNEKWNIRWRELRDEIHEFTGTIETSGEFFNITHPSGDDGYSINESTDVITSTVDKISFEAFIDGYDEERNEEMYAVDGLSFLSGDKHYIFDMKYGDASNTMSLFKDGTGYLNFQVFDNKADRGFDAGFYNLSTNIRDWEENKLYHVAVSWRFNSANERDEMHLFIDGEEVTNLFKYGGNPKASASFDFGDVAEETVISNSINAIYGGFDGKTTAGSNIFEIESGSFEGAGIQVGGSLYLLDETPDGTGNPNFGAAYTITGVGTDRLSLDRSFTLTLQDLKYSVNSVTATVTTPVNFQDFIVVSMDADGNETELSGLDSDEPDYYVRRASNNTHVIEIYDGVGIGESALIKPLGLLFQRCREKVYVYGGDETEIMINAPAPVTLGDVKITSIILDRTLIETGGGFGVIGTVVGAQLVTMLQSRFDEVCQPSNDSAGRTLKITLSGDNINYNIPGNQIIIEGQTYSGATSESLLFEESGSMTSTEYWTRIDNVIVSVIPIDAALPSGIVEIRENKPITESENNGDFAEVVDYSNGIITLETYGTAGNPFYLNSCMYEVDFPSFVRIKFDKQPDTFYIGSDSAGNHVLDAVIDEFRILDYMSEDTKTGEEIEVGERSVTTDIMKKMSFLQITTHYYFFTLMIPQKIHLTI
jgi:hypothetical protein